MARTEPRSDSAAQQPAPPSPDAAPGPSAADAARPGDAAPPASGARHAAHAPWRIERSRSDRILAGVAGGLAERLGVDAVIVRLAFVVLSFAAGAGVIAYVVCWAL